MPFFAAAKKELSVSDVIYWVKGLDGQVTCLEDFPAREAQFGIFGRLDRRVAEALKQRGIERLYSHQSEAAGWAMAGRDVVVATPTASGKTLCYNLPVLDAVVKDRNARALYLFPTKALAQDQLAELAEFAAVLDGAVSSSAYDGDTPPAQRPRAREANIVITNPDMLNAGILPHHPRWADFFRNLKFVVVDELHTYRGVFGSHMANLFARLLRVCEFYGSRPVFICCSATTANPAEHAKALTGREVRLVTESGAPSAEKKFLIYNPRLLDRQTGLRRSALFETARIAAKALCGGVSTIVFTRSRINVELLLQALRGKLAEEGCDPALVTGYRSGYLPKERRKIERDLRSGKLRGVVSTNALELGIDIGSLELAVLHGYPGSVASAWQQIGRAGRRGGLSAAVMVASAAPLDQFLAARPRWFLNATPEQARIDPANPYIRVNHVRCSAFELPFHAGEKFAGEDIGKILDYLAEHGVLQLSGDSGAEAYYWQEDSYPAAGLSLRSATGDNYVIVDAEGGRTRVIGSMDRHSAPALLFPGAVYFHGGQSYVVEELDTENRQCLVKTARADYYTESESSSRIGITEEFERSGAFGWGDALLATTPAMYKKIKLTTHENVGQGKIDLPEEEMETTACWFTMPPEMLESPVLGAAMNGLVNLIRNTAPLFLMCDKGDIQVLARLKDTKLRRPAIFVADNVPGGVGLAEGVFGLKGRLLEACRDALDSCPCERGCPACTGAAPEQTDLKEEVRGLIDEILRCCA